ncbi:TetR/AcrR family transcriptional regulator [Cellulomonas sp. PhB143]|uniref:TetR/AcrR family transcriptional regulator n=1 Tax=Cellulomonas sp. PhB143 TaxID=2485186 RepID=UPI0018F72EA5|nr:TetR family transcriptional regulator [Cellulomonas sp. PhB143]
MTTRTSRTGRRADALSKERIVAAAIEILDADGESALTFRALAARLATGSGAIYWHVANKGELLAAACDDVVARAMAPAGRSTRPSDAVRNAALGVFDAIDAHPWVGTQLIAEPWQPAVVDIFERLGAPLEELGVPASGQFDAASALLSHLLGLAGQYAAGARLLPPDADRSDFLRDVAERWASLDPEEHPFVHRMAARLPRHDDRAQFLAGIDLFLAGVAGAADPAA